MKDKWIKIPRADIVGMKTTEVMLVGTKGVLVRTRIYAGDEGRDSGSVDMHFIPNATLQDFGIELP